ncbi:hypothetical protein B6U91_00950 [Candidatus Pacearchaeota archaeon ex4484_71]|nr:MAG: hypothetical protein B6U91_00950 [Candidatus Pacearchaeota archaeon ex4484_71]
MKKILSKKAAKIIRNKKTLEKALGVRITSKGKEITIEGSPEDEYLGQEVIDAINFGFPISSSLAIKNEEKILEFLNIKDHTKRQDLERIRARIIGRGGRGLRTLTNLTECFIEIEGNRVGIIGNPESIKIATEAVISLIKGSKHGNVYKFLEKNKSHLLAEDLGLKRPE